MKNRTKLRKTYNLLIQVAILLLTYGFIYKEVFHRKNFPRVVESLWTDFSGSGVVPFMILVVALMVLNWGIESEKWRFLMAKIERVSYWKAYQAVLAGITISSFTPNRVGEYFGRVFSLHSGNRVEGILITILGSMSQLLVTILTGSVALLIFLPYFSNQYFVYNGYLYYLVVTVAIGLNVLLVALYLNIRLLTTWKKWFLRRGLKKIRRFLRVFGYFPNQALLWALFLSFVRYLVFSTQFFLLLRVFAVPIPYFQALMLISLIYFVMTVIPTIAFTELGIRGSVAIYFFTIYFQGYPMDTDKMAFSVFAATTVLWIINLGIPALVGSVFVFRLTFFRKNNQRHT